MKTAPGQGHRDGMHIGEIGPPLAFAEMQIVARDCAGRTASWASASASARNAASPA
jgi:hypothetical protein